MKDFKEISEGILGDIDTTIKQADKTVKRLKEIDDIRKLKYLLNDMYYVVNNTGKNTDRNGVKIEFGDVVACRDGNYDEIFGIVIRDKTTDGDGIFEVAAAEARVPDERDQEFGDFITYHFNHDNITVLAKKRYAKKMLELLVKLK